MSSSPAFAETDFRKASASRPDRECVRVARRDGWVELRDDKTTFGAPDDHRLLFTAEQFDHFLTSVRSGNTDHRCLAMTHRADETIAFHHAAPSVLGPRIELVFTEAEVAAFLDGIHNHEFDLPAYTA